ncbi:MAG: tetratricopeptide repeat protein [Thermodesulfobacteriota bacterium]|nr:tetratricopeptide repeat protein [Thermodesulfobacteriota bacterium]
MGNRRHAKGLILLLALVFCALPFYEAMAQTSVIIKADDQFAFAEAYFHRGEYYRAIGEYKRFIHFFPKEPRVASARYKIGLAYVEGQRFKEAIEALGRVILEYPATELSFKSYLKIAACHVKLGEPDEALGTLDTLLKVSQDQDMRDEALYQGGWIFLARDEWEKARAAFDGISPKNRDQYRLKELSQEINKKESIKAKNPTTAGLLAVMPGAGHLYLRRYRDALVSFFLNGAMIFAAVEAFDNDNEALGGLLTFFEIGLYSGNIYSAVNSAHKYNQKERHDFLEYLKEHTTIEVSGRRPNGKQAMALCCKIKF